MGILCFLLKYPVASTKSHKGYSYLIYSFNIVDGTNILILVLLYVLGHAGTFSPPISNIYHLKMIPHKDQN